jgi:hypothetical protein
MAYLVNPSHTPDLRELLAGNGRAAQRVRLLDQLETGAGWRVYAKMARDN